MSPALRNVIVVALLGGIPPLATAYLRTPPEPGEVDTLARQAQVRAVSEGERAAAGGVVPGPDGLQRVSDAQAAASDAVVQVRARCTPFTFNWFTSAHWYYEVAVGSAAPFWMEVAALPGGPALFQAHAPGPAPGCISR